MQLAIDAFPAVVKAVEERLPTCPECGSTDVTAVFGGDLTLIVTVGKDRAMGVAFDAVRNIAASCNQCDHNWS